MAMWLSFLLVFLIGFAAHRASLCTVRAVKQWIEHRKAGLFVSFLKASIWATLLTGIFVWVGLPIRGAPIVNSTLVLSVSAGFLFGVGAAINRGCSLSTLQGLADGDPRFAVTLVFFVIGGLTISGVQSFGLLPPPEVRPLLWRVMPETIRNGVILMLATWAVWQLSVLWRYRDPGRRLGYWLLAPRYRLTLAAAILGVCSGFLFLLEGAWSYTNYLRETGASWVIGSRAPGGHRTGLVLALFLGMVVSAIQRRSFSWRGWTGVFNWRNVSGGYLMGIAGAMIPGGNDTLLLVLMPTLSWHAASSFASLLLGIGMTQRVLRGMNADDRA